MADPLVQSDIQSPRSSWLDDRTSISGHRRKLISSQGFQGFWFSPELEALQALISETQRDVSGVTRLKLSKRNIIVAGRKSPKSLYDSKIATIEGDLSWYDQSDATGFILLKMRCV